MSKNTAIKFMWSFFSDKGYSIQYTLCDNIIFTLLTHMQPVNQYAPIHRTDL